MVIDLTPAIAEIESAETAQSAAEEPAAIRKFATRPSEKQRVRIRNAAPEIRQALEEITAVLQFSLYGPVALLALKPLRRSFLTCSVKSSVRT